MCHLTAAITRPVTSSRLEQETARLGVQLRPLTEPSSSSSSSSSSSAGRGNPFFHHGRRRCAAQVPRLKPSETHFNIIFPSPSSHPLDPLWLAFEGVGYRPPCNACSRLTKPPRIDDTRLQIRRSPSESRALGRRKWKLNTRSGHLPAVSSAARGSWQIAYPLQLKTAPIGHTEHGEI